jgi:HEAT repeat protein
MRPRPEAPRPVQRDQPPDAAGERVIARAGAPVTPIKPMAHDAAPPAGEVAPEAKPPVDVANLPPEAIDLDDYAEDITALSKVAFSDPDPERRLTAVELLSATEDPQVVTVLARALADSNEDVRMAALQALSDFTGEAPMLAVENALRDPSPDIRYEALSMLAEAGTDRARAAIHQALNDPDEEVRFLAESVLELHRPSDQVRVPGVPGQGQPVQR